MFDYFCNRPRNTNSLIKKKNEILTCNCVALWTTLQFEIRTVSHSSRNTPYTSRRRAIAICNPQWFTPWYGGIVKILFIVKTAIALYGKMHPADLMGRQLIQTRVLWDFRNDSIVRLSPREWECGGRKENIWGRNPILNNPPTRRWIMQLFIGDSGSTTLT